MPRGNWSFIHEWVIYDYLMDRFADGMLRLKCIIKEGYFLRREIWAKVAFLEPIKNTDFPDIKKIQFSNERIMRQAEIKFNTHLFNYHNNGNYISAYSNFISNNGFLLVLSHDYLPKGLSSIDVYEIDKSDFSSYCRENFNRLLNRQIKLHSESKVWLMYQGPNFNIKKSKIKPARESHIWCPTDNLTAFDLALGDRILFIKTEGASTQKVQSNYKMGMVYDEWCLKELWIGEVSSGIYSRYEYCQLKNLDFGETKLWENDPKTNGEWRWNRVFQFNSIKVISLEKKMIELYNNIMSKSLVEATIEAFCYNKSRELTNVEYRNILEGLI